MEPPEAEMQELLMNEQQSLAIKAALEGHNFHLNGPAGTGKSFVLVEMVKRLRATRTVYLTSTTGISCLNFPRSIGAMTINRWAGIEDGRHTTSELIELLKFSPHFKNTYSRIKDTDVLIIDEISMLSSKNFNQLEEICRQIRNNHTRFGGLQVIVSGDFLQLPPVANPLYSDEGEFCFTSAAFQETIRHKITLTEIMRQKDMRLINAIKTVSSGHIDEDTVNLMKELERPLQDPGSTKLFANNFLVDSYNRKRILEWDGPLIEYKAKDSGDNKYFPKITAQKTLWLKRGVPVILLRNLSDKLVNGLKGTVVGFEEEGPVVEFEGGVTTIVKKTTFSVYSPSLQKDLATREQFPLKLAFAITIHKAQGMTLRSVEVDAQQIFKPGQLGVAIGRVRTTDSLRVINFHPRVVKPQPEVIDAFLQKESAPFCDDVSCCKVLVGDGNDVDVQDEGRAFVIEEEDNSGGEEEFDEEFDSIIANINISEINEPFELPESFKIEEILKDIISEPAVTSEQRSVNEVVLSVLRNMANITKFCQKEYVVLKTITDSMNINEPVPVKAEHLTEFYSKSHQHQRDIEYQVNCMLAFEGETLSDAHWHVCYKLYVAIRKYFLAEKATIYPVSDIDIANRRLTESSKCRVRYVGGYCVQSVRKEYMKQVNANMYSTTSQGVTQYNKAHEMVKILNCLREEEENIKNTTEDKESLKDVIRKQNISRGLTNIPDDLYQFFVALCEMCLNVLVAKNVNSFDARLHEFCINTILNTESLYNEFKLILNSHYSTVDLENEVHPVAVSSLSTTNLFEAVSRKFLLVMLNQFRRDLLQSFRVSKTMAHRKQIQIKKQKQESRKLSVTLESIRKDASENKTMSHSLLRGLLMSESDVFKDMKKTDILKLCNAYNVKVQSKTKKSEIVSILSNAVVLSSEMVNPGVLNEETGSSPMVHMSTDTAVGDAEPEPISTDTAVGDAEPEPMTTDTAVGDAEPEPMSSDTAVGDAEQSTSAVRNTPELMDTEDNEDSDLCKKCNKTGKEGVQWIQCRGCVGWFHRNCAGLRAKKAWIKFSKPGTDFFCSECK